MNSTARRTSRRLPLFALALVLATCLGAVTGCSSGETAVVLTDEQQANRSYMEQVNIDMESFAAIYASFAECISNGDADEAKEYASSATKTLESLKSIEVPEAMTDIQTAYVAGCEKLVASVDAYVSLAESGLDTASQEYADKLAEVQKLYDEGVNKLQEGDTAAAAKE